MSKPTPVIQMQEISKSFGGVRALDNVHMEAYAGEVHALLGENGAGKSTLIKTMTGVHQSDSGEIYLHGELVRFSGPREAQQQGIGAIYQEPSLFPDLDIAENIMAGRQPTRGGRVDWGAMYREARDLLQQLGVRLDPRTKARNLSVAQQQTVEIARALSLNAQILIMDEPTSSLTLTEVEELFRIIRQLREAGTAVIFISHRLEELFAVADRVTILRDGQYVGTREMADVKTEDLIQMMVGRQVDDLFPKQEAPVGKTLLEVTDLTAKGKFENVSFKLRAGEILGLAGLIGAGRTDVARALFGILPVDSGSIQVDGQPVAIRSPQQAMSLGLAFVPEDRQHHGLVLPMSLAANITLPILPRFATAGWLREGEAKKVAETAAQRLEVKSAGIAQKAKELSGGNQQKVVLAKWLETNPRILILDEPTRGIDVGTKAAVHQLMSDLANQGVAILMISSELPEILGMSDRVLVMREGRITGEFSRAEATQEKLMASATATSTGSVQAVAGKKQDERAHKNDHG
ncbi:MAG: D-xylose ABC transporter ATP-binding protein [Anaerolineaceae bacterium]|nr:D-xylose ABC transporter ATP-binding protein [Anaerolineaceae bacterium]